MLQRYRLRLGDGTILQVDKDGLQAWVEDDRRAMVQVAGTQQWRPLREFLAEEESAARLKQALIPPEPRRTTPPPPPEPEPEPPPPAEPPAPAYEPPAPAYEPPAPAYEPPAPVYEPPAPVYEPPAPAYEPPAPAYEPPAPAFEAVVGEPRVQALAEEPSAPIPPWQVPPEAPGGEAPAIRFKPMEEEPHAPADGSEIVEDEPQDPYAIPVPRAYGAARVEEDGIERHDRLEGPLLQVLTAFGTLLSRLLDPLTPLVRDWPARSSVARAPRAADRKASKPARETPRAPAPLPAAAAPVHEPPPAFEPTPAPPSPKVSGLAEEPGRTTAEPEGDAIPVVPLKPLPEDEGPLASAWRGFSGRVAGTVARVSTGLAGASVWVAGLPARLASLRGRDRGPTSVVPPVEPVRRKAPSATPPPPATPRPPAPLRPPTPIAELPSLRLKEGYEPPDEGDVYEGEEWEGWSLLPVVWMWTKRIVLLGGLVGAGALVALHWDTWFPKAAELGQTLFTEIDRQAHSTQRARERDQAFTNAVERCPHLAPATVRLVLSTSSDGVLEPPEVFGVAAEAADRGITTLSPVEAAELRALQHELATRLRPPQRARLAEYDRARATRVVFPFENPAALDLVARGARALPAASRARLQELLGKAVAAGLGLPAASPASAPAEAGAAR
jgi:hypothetical protein